MSCKLTALSVADAAPKAHPWRSMETDTMTMDPQQAWQDASNLLAKQWDRANYETWLRPTSFLRFENDCLVIGVPDSYVFDMLTHRLFHDVKEAVREVMGRDITVEFRVQQPPATAAAPPADAELPLFQLLKRSENGVDGSPPSTIQNTLRGAAASDPVHSAINPQMNFDRYITNDSNNLAAEAARAVAEHPATVYNPFLVYGGVGIGKTHLLQAIANSCGSRGLQVLYVSSEAFTNDLVHAIRNRTPHVPREIPLGRCPARRRHPIHPRQRLHPGREFLPHLQHPRQLQQTNCPRLRPPSARTKNARRSPALALSRRLGRRYRTAELETRIAIMELWARERDLHMPMNVLHMIAERSSSCIRELHGLFNQIAARLRLGGDANLSMSRAEAALNRYEKPTEQITIIHVIDVIAGAFNLDSAALQGQEAAGAD